MSAAVDKTGRVHGWQRLEVLVQRAQRAGLRTLTEDELWELPSLYRQAMADLSLLKASHAAPIEEQHLAQLCNAAHTLIYGHHRASAVRTTPGEYLLKTLPEAVRRRRGFVLIAGAIMLLFAAIGWVHAVVSPQIVETVLPAPMYLGYRAELESARSEKDLRLAAQIEVEERPLAAFEITVNNIGVSARALAFGIAGGIPAVLILSFNGYLLGVIGYLYFTTQSAVDVNLPLYFIAGIAPHGSIELPAICLAGGAGMLIGFAWLFPGQRGRGENLRLVIPDAVRLLVVCALTLLIAGAIEGFVTPLNAPASIDLETWFWAKIGFGALVLLGWLVWLAAPGHRQPTVLAT